MENKQLQFMMLLERQMYLWLLFLVLSMVIPM